MIFLAQGCGFVRTAPLFACLLSVQLLGCASTVTPCPASATSTDTGVATLETSPSSEPKAAAPAVAPPALSLWTESPRRQAILDFVAEVSDPKRPSFVPTAERIAVFDNDGTLWSEQPMYVQLAFALDRIKALSPEHPEWKKKQPYKAVLEGDMKTLTALGNAGLIPLMM